MENEKSNDVKRQFKEALKRAGDEVDITFEGISVERDMPKLYDCPSRGAVRKFSDDYANKMEWFGSSLFFLDDGSEMPLTEEMKDRYIMEIRYHFFPKCSDIWEECAWGMANQILKLYKTDHDQRPKLKDGKIIVDTNISDIVFEDDKNVTVYFLQFTELHQVASMAVNLHNIIGNNARITFSQSEILREIVE